MTEAARWKILVVDDDRALVDWLCEDLTAAGHDPCAVTSVSAALVRLKHQNYDAVVSDVVMPEAGGMDLVHTLRRHQLTVPVILMTGFGTVDLAVRAMKAGAADFLSKPFAIESLLASLTTHIRPVPDGQSGAVAEERPPVAVAPSMRQLLTQVDRIAATTIPVLLTGESGTGKGEIARYLHLRSSHARGPWVAVNAAALPASLIEAELFGVRQGAYTDSKQHRRGLFHSADKGTLFLDEIGELQLQLQPKLLHVLETGRIRAVGSDTEEEVEVRLIAATNADLHVAVREGTFRQDLLYRLAVVHLHVPPLRERTEDIEPLVMRFLMDANRRFHRRVSSLTPAAWDILRRYRWPGNVRELRNAVERAVVLSQQTTLDTEAFAAMALAAPTEPTQPVHATVSNDGDWTTAGPGSDLSLESVERLHIESVLHACGGNQSLAARRLGIDRKTLSRKLAR
jgi:DNA-binding NtrC family response regulator